MLRLIREFFWSKHFIEVETPLLLKLPGQEPYLSPMKLQVHNERQRSFGAYLHTSPEYTLKKMLAAGYENIFSLCKVFRDYESFGGTHNPEFTMIEWYRAHSDFYAIMQDVEELFVFLGERLRGIAPKQVPLPVRRMHMRELWQQTIGVDLDAHLSETSMRTLCRERGYMPQDEEPYEDLFFRIFLNEIEPKLQTMGTVIVHHFPVQMAALSRAAEDDPRYAERFEVYVHGLELANAFSELTDGEEQKRRLIAEHAHRRLLGKDVFDIDDAFIEAVSAMPPSAGIALGVDRLVQVFAGQTDIDRVLPLPASLLFQEEE